MDGWQLRERRRRAGLTLRQVARAAGTAESNVSAYERGALSPSRRTLDRMTAMIDAGSHSPIHAMTLMTAPATASALRAGLRAQWTTAELLRLVREMKANARHLRDEADWTAFLAEPSTSGDPRWDAMLAGVSEGLALDANRTPPAWTSGHALPTFWFVGSAAGLRAYAFARSPFPLQVRGVMVDPGDLEQEPA